MPITININGLTLCHRGSGGVSHNTLPDVCKTPDKGTPVAYENEAYSRDLVRGTTTVFADGGHSIATYGSRFARSVFDEPGSMGGILSGTHKDEAEWITHSFDVFIEGRPACRLTDKMFMNRRNTVNLAGLCQPDLSEQEFVDALCEMACACFNQHKPDGPAPLKPGQTYQDCLNKKIQAECYDGRYPKADSSVWREVPFDRGSGWEMIGNQAGDGVPTSNYLRPNTRRLDIAQVRNGKIEKLWDVKFRGDDIGRERRGDYERIAEKHTGDPDNYNEFDVDEMCNECPDDPPTGTAPVTESVPDRVPQTGPTAGDYATLVGLGVLTVGLALIPLDGPLGEAAAGTAFLAQAARIGL